MAHRWGEAKTLKFVQLYRLEECLWDKTHLMYRNNFNRDQAYKKIIRGMGDPALTVPDVKTKIKNLRSTYYQELKKMGDSRVYRPAVSWFNELHAVMRDLQQKAAPMEPVTRASLIKVEPLDQDEIAEVEELTQETPSSSCYAGRPSSTEIFSDDPKLQAGLQEECELFGRYVTACLIRLPMESRLAAENAIFQILMKEKINACKTENRRLSNLEDGRFMDTSTAMDDLYPAAAQPADPLKEKSGYERHNEGRSPSGDLENSVWITYERRRWKEEIKNEEGREEGIL